MLEFAVAGDPKPQGSKRGFVTKHGRVALVEQAGRPLKQWRDTVTAAAAAARIREKWPAYTEGPIGIELVFGLKKPLKPKYPVPAVRPDIDKLVRAVLDGLTDAHLWQDDGQVIELYARKTYSEQGLVVRVWTIQ